MASLGLCYVRLMDDVLVLSPMRCKLRQAVRGGAPVIGKCEMLASESSTGFQGHASQPVGAALGRSE